MILDIVQVSVGGAKNISSEPGKTVMSAIEKYPVTTPTIEVGWENLAGDEQADKRTTRDRVTGIRKRIHGGPLQAVYVYPGEHLEEWKRDTGLDFDPGAFGENLTTWGAVEEDVRIGDVFACEGEGVAFRVTKPRRPCAKLPLHLGIDDMALRMMSTGRCGWYMAVERPGLMPVYSVLELVESDPTQPTVAEVFARKVKDNPTIPGLP